MESACGSLFNALEQCWQTMCQRVFIGSLHLFLLLGVVRALTIWGQGSEAGQRQGAELQQCFWVSKGRVGFFSNSSFLRLGQPLWKTVWKFVKKFKMDLIYQKKPNTLIQKNICTPVFIAALLTNASFGSNPSAHQQMSGYKSHGTYTQWNIIQPKKERNLTICNSMDGPRRYYAK